MVEIKLKADITIKFPYNNKPIPEVEEAELVIEFEHWLNSYGKIILGRNLMGQPKRKLVPKCIAYPRFHIWKKE